jgi:hypothetical protein
MISRVGIRVWDRRAVLPRRRWVVHSVRRNIELRRRMVEVEWEVVAVEMRRGYVLVSRVRFRRVGWTCYGVVGSVSERRH